MEKFSTVIPARDSAKPKSQSLVLVYLFFNSDRRLRGVLNDNGFLHAAIGGHVAGVFKRNRASYPIWGMRMLVPPWLAHHVAGHASGTTIAGRICKWGIEKMTTSANFLRASMLAAAMAGFFGSAEAATINPTLRVMLGDSAVQDGIADVTNSSIAVKNVSGGAQFRGILEFNISSLDPLASATLNLTRQFSTYSASQVIEVYGYTGNGAFNLSDYSAGSLIGSFNYFNETTVNVDVTAFVNSQIFLNSSFVGFRLSQLGSTATEQNVSFGSSPSTYPTLTVIEGSPAQTPLPAALPLFATGLGALGLAAWRRKRNEFRKVGKIAVLATIYAGCWFCHTATALTINSTVHGFVRDVAGQDGIGDGSNPTSVEVFNVLNGGQDRGVIEFDISGLSSVTSAVLNLSKNASSFVSSRTINVYGFTGDGILGLGDYALGTLIGSFSYFNEAVVALDVTAFINSQILLNHPLHFAGFLLAIPTPGPDEYLQFGNQFDARSTFPTLAILEGISPTPLPGALPLFASGLGALGLAAWRRRRAVRASP